MPPLGRFLLYLRLGCSVRLEILWVFLKFSWEHFRKKIFFFITIFLSTYDVITLTYQYDKKLFYRLLFLYKRYTYEISHTFSMDEVLQIPHFIFSIMAEFFDDVIIFWIFENLLTSSHLCAILNIFLIQYIKYN